MSATKRNNTEYHGIPTRDTIYSLGSDFVWFGLVRIWLCFGLFGFFRGVVLVFPCEPILRLCSSFLTKCNKNLSIQKWPINRLWWTFAFVCAIKSLLRWFVRSFLGWIVEWFVFISVGVLYMSFGILDMCVLIEAVSIEWGAPDSFGGKPFIKWSININLISCVNLHEKFARIQ